MGLLLSTFVSCVGVLELVAFYFHLRRQLAPTNESDANLGQLQTNYKHLLAKKHTLELRCEGTKVDRNFALSTSPKAVFVTQNDAKRTTSNGVERKTENVETAKPVGRLREFILDIASNVESDIEKMYVREVSPVDPVHGKRESSPFPTYERLAPRGSICELAENPTISVTEVDEEDNAKDYRAGRRSRSGSPKRRRSDLCRKHKLDIKMKRCRSVSPETINEVVVTEEKRSRSVVDVQVVEDSDKRFQLVFDEDFMNSLDGVKQKDERKRDFRRRREMRTAKKEVSEEEAGGSKETKEAFWVK